MPNALNPSHLTAAERLDEVGRILAAGILRARAKNLESKVPTIGQERESSLLAYPVNADTHYMLGAPNRRSRVQRRSAPQPRPRSPAMI